MFEIQATDSVIYNTELLSRSQVSSVLLKLHKHRMCCDTSSNRFTTVNKLKVSTPLGLVLSVCVGGGIKPSHHLRCPDNTL